MKKPNVRTVQFLSIGLILIVWVISIIRNTVFADSIPALFESMPKVFLLAFVTAVAVISVVTLLLRMSGEKFRDIGFKRENLVKQMGNGFLFGAVIFLLDTFLVSPLLSAILPSTAAQGVDMEKLFSNTAYILVFLIIGLVKGGFSEELWRVFALTRFEKVYGKTGLILALIISSLMFGVGHLYQGLSGMMSISIIGFFYALVYLRKRSALEAVMAHSTLNIISIILGYAIYAGN